jgi:hypothetical protein
MEKHRDVTKKRDFSPKSLDITPCDAPVIPFPTWRLWCEVLNLLRKPLELVIKLGSKVPQRRNKRFSGPQIGKIDLADNKILFIIHSFS